MLITALVSIGWAYLHQGRFQSGLPDGVSRWTRQWAGFWILVFPIPFGVALGVAGQRGKQRLHALVRRLPIDANDLLRARVVVTFAFGLPMWGVVTWLLVSGLPINDGFPWALVGTAFDETTTSGGS